MARTVGQGEEFKFHDGTMAGSLEELLEKLKQIPQEEFASFANESKNDFANWVENSLHEKILAERLRSTTNKDIIILKIMEKLEEYKAQENIFNLAQQKGRQGSGAGKDASGNDTGASGTSPAGNSKSGFVNLSILEKKLIFKELLIGIGLGILLGLFLAKIISVWVQI